MIDWVIDKEKVMTWLSDVSLRPCDYVSDEYSEEEVERYSNDALALLKEQEWNRLTEDDNGLVCGLPGDDGTYLMTDGKDIWVDDYVDGVDDGVWLDSGRDIREIKAWMYMPELPK